MVLLGQNKKPRKTFFAYLSLQQIHHKFYYCFFQQQSGFACILQIWHIFEEFVSKNFSAGRRLMVCPVQTG